MGIGLEGIVVGRGAGVGVFLPAEYKFGGRCDLLEEIDEVLVGVRGLLVEGGQLFLLDHLVQIL